jgi:RimJ/RimL family protein N-acetyltransferase
MPEFAWDHLPELRTARLLLRTMTPVDRHALLEIYGDPEVMHYASDPPFTDVTTVDQMLSSVAQLFAERQSLEWGIQLHTDPLLIGTCGLHSFQETPATAEIGCLLRRSHWGQSLMREALEAVMLFGVGQLRLSQIEAEIDAPNQRSIALFTRLGFRQQPDAETRYCYTPR